MENNQNAPGHYYGDIVRNFYITTGILMIATLPFFNDIINLPVLLSIAAILILSVLGGSLNPRLMWSIVVNLIIAVVGLAVFEYYAVYTYMHLSAEVSKNVIFFWVNQIFSLLFFFATYLSVRTLRWKILTKKEGSNN